MSLKKDEPTRDHYSVPLIVTFGFISFLFAFHYQALYANLHEKYSSLYLNYNETSYRLHTIMTEQAKELDTLKKYIKYTCFDTNDNGVCDHIEFGKRIGIEEFSAFMNTYDGCWNYARDDFCYPPIEEIFM
jgi:hypothetical protein